MRKLEKELKVTNRNIDQDYGFFHIEFNFDGTEYFLQCCLKSRYKNHKITYLKQISKDDNGYDDGICGDANRKSFEKFGEAKCLRLLLSNFKKAN